MADEHAMDVHDNPDADRYEIEVDGTLAGFVRYRDEDGAVVLVHTEVFDDYEGKGVGSELARRVLDDLRERGRSVVPQCPFIAAYVDKHSDYADLVRPRS